jgi:hypothetical protein
MASLMPGSLFQPSSAEIEVALETVTVAHIRQDDPRRTASDSPDVGLFQGLQLEDP